MPPYYRWNICQSHISDISYYRILNDTDPSNIVQQRVTQFPDKYKSMLTLASPVYHTSGISEILHIVMEPSLVMILHIAKDSFDFKNRLDKHCSNLVLKIFHKTFYKNFHKIFH